MDLRAVEFVYEKAKMFKVIKRRIKDSSSYIGNKFKSKIKNSSSFSFKVKRLALGFFMETATKFSSLVMCNSTALSVSARPGS